MNVLRGEAIKEVLSSAPDHLGAEHDFVDGIKQDIGRSIMTPMEGVRQLALRVRNVQHRVANRAGPTLTPGVIEIGHYTQQRQSHALDRLARIGRIRWLDTNVNRRVIHEVLDALTVN